jgi:type I restriction enzyme S subunit
MAISNEDFMAMPLPVPSADEQQKIADCLSSLNALITAQADKIDALKTHKKGLMQQLFPREGETVPRLRFPEFRDSGEWGRTQLSTQVELISGLHLSPTEYADSGEIPYFTGPSDYSNELSTVRKWTARSENVGRSDDTLITVKGNGVGELLRLKLDAVAMGRQLMAVRPSIAHGGFIFYFLETQRQRLIELASGNLIPGLSRGDILSLEILVPEKQEQIKVANCFSALDALIAAATENLDALKTHKKGLIQQLFPNNQEAVGE